MNIYSLNQAVLDTPLQVDFRYRLQAWGNQRDKRD